MPAQRDHTNWQEVESDHADDPTYVRLHGDPTEPPTDEKRTAEEAEGDE